MRDTDVIVIGGGVVGCATADALARRGASVVLLEKGDDVAVGASRANSGIVHAGYDCEPNTLKARFNRRGNEMMWTLARELGVPHKKCGSLVAAPDGGEEGLRVLLGKAEKNGVRAEIVSRERALEIEPNLSDDVRFCLYAPEAGVISPYKLTIKLAERAVLNGTAVVTEAAVEKISQTDGKYVLSTPKGDFKCRFVVNCAGAGAEKVNVLAGAECFETVFRRGDYFVLDSTEGDNVSTVIFPLPTAAGKGILVAPTADGNVIYGPTSVPVNGADTAVASDALDEIRRAVPLTYRRPAFNKCIRVYAGVRAIVGDDFIVRESDVRPGFFTVAGICSPGLTAAPAIAEYVAGLIGGKMPLAERNDAVVELPHAPRLTELSDDEINALVAHNPAWGRIVCRCEKVTEAEIVAAVHSPVPAVTVDAVKRRVRAGMGRCQGGFCAPRVMEIIARETGVPLSAVRKGGEGSEIAVVKVGEADYD